MGGNAKIKGYTAEPIPNQEDFIEVLVEDLKWMIDTFKENKINLVPSGSTEHMMSGKIPYHSDEPWMLGWAGKLSYGDVDFMFDAEQYESLFSLLNNIVTYGAANSTWALLAVQKTDQLITIWNWRGRQIQIDFEPAEYVAGEPTEWAKFCHSSPIDDLEYGIKGVFHKHLLRALNAPDVRDVLIKNTKGFKEIKSAEYALSVTGLRRKLYPVIVKNKFGTESHLMVDRRLVFHEPKGKSWVTDLDIIFAFYFGKERTPKVNKEQLKSFTSLANMLLETRSYDDRLKIVHGFVNTIWGKGAQKLYRDDDKKDELEKRRAFDRLCQILKVPESLWENAADGYYGRETEEYQAL